MSNQQCPRCGRQQPEASTAGKCEFCGADLPAATGQAVLVPPPPPPPDAPLPVPPPPAEADDVTEVEAGKKRCPGCGEMLYDTENRCWRCGQEFEQPVAEEPAPEAAPAPPPPPVTPPAPGLPATIPVAPPAYSVPPVPETARQAQVLGVWSLVLGIVGLFFCLGVISPVALYLGVRANRTGPNNLGTAGIVLGLIGTAILVIAAIVMFVTLRSHGGTGITPEASPNILLPHLRLWL